MTTGRRVTSLRRGDIVLVPFPFAELSAAKARPALVVSGERFLETEGKIIVAAITSNVRARTGPTNYRLADWRQAGLLKPSVITSWLATLFPAIVLMRIGTLPAADLHAVASRLRMALSF